jgi:hypothetical protein
MPRTRPSSPAPRTPTSMWPDSSSDGDLGAPSSSGAYVRRLRTEVRIGGGGAPSLGYRPQDEPPTVELGVTDELVSPGGAEVVGDLGVAQGQPANSGLTCRRG